jgi:glycosyltransferase involved in cell wall biosynthesis
VRWVSWGPGDGYGDAAVQYMLALEAAGVDVTWTPLLWEPEEPDPRVWADYDGAHARLAHVPVEVDTVVVHHPADGAHRWRDGTARRQVLFTTWETDRVPHGWTAACAEWDTVMVPSTFNRDALLADGFTGAVHAVPHCARTVGQVESAQFDRLDDRFVFYTIGTWSTRKAMADTIRAFLDAFGRDDDVALLVKTSPVNQIAVARAHRGEDPGGPNRFPVATWPAVAALLAGRADVPELQLVTEHLTAEEIDGLHARGDCFLSLTRSEGWGLCIADALVFDNPVVVTGWGGQLDYLGADYPLLVDYDLIPTTDDEADDWFAVHEDYRWAKARHDHAVDLLRWVADHRDEAAAIGRRVGQRVRTEYAPEVVGAQLLEVLSRARP